MPAIWIGPRSRSDVEEHPITVTPVMMVDNEPSVKQKIGGLPVVGSRVVGAITTDILQAFLDVMGASEGTHTRIDFVLEGERLGFG